MKTKTTPALPNLADDPDYASAIARHVELTDRSETLKREWIAAVDELSALRKPMPKPTVEEAADALLARRQAHAEAVQSAAKVIHRKIADIEYDQAVVAFAIDRHLAETVGPARSKAAAAVAPAVWKQHWKPAVRRVAAALIELAKARQAFDELKAAMQASELFDGERFADPTPFDFLNHHTADPYGPIGTMARQLIASKLADPSDPILAGVQM